MKLITTIFLLTFFTTAFAQTKPKKSTVVRDSVDNRMKGPNNEPIIIGKSGGRYYWKNGNKVYVEYKGNKNKKSAAKKD
jgi:hypothetical protein